MKNFMVHFSLKRFQKRNKTLAANNMYPFPSKLEKKKEKAKKAANLNTYIFYIINRQGASIP